MRRRTPSAVVSPPHNQIGPPGPVSRLVFLIIDLFVLFFAAFKRLYGEVGFACAFLGRRPLLFLSSGSEDVAEDGLVDPNASAATPLSMPLADPAIRPSSCTRLLFIFLDLCFARRPRRRARNNVVSTESETQLRRGSQHRRPNQTFFSTPVLPSRQGANRASRSKGDEDAEPLSRVSSTDLSPSREYCASSPVRRKMNFSSSIDQPGNDYEDDYGTSFDEKFGILGREDLNVNVLTPINRAVVPMARSRSGSPVSASGGGRRLEGRIKPDVLGQQDSYFYTGQSHGETEAENARCDPEESTVLPHEIQRWSPYFSRRGGEPPLGFLDFVDWRTGDLSATSPSLNNRKTEQDDLDQEENQPDQLKGGSFASEEGVRDDFLLEIEDRKHTANENDEPINRTGKADSQSGYPPPLTKSPSTHQVKLELQPTDDEDLGNRLPEADHANGETGGDELEVGFGELSLSGRSNFFEMLEEIRKEHAASEAELKDYDNARRERLSQERAHLLWKLSERHEKGMEMDQRVESAEVKLGIEELNSSFDSQSREYLARVSDEYLNSSRRRSEIFEHNRESLSKCIKQVEAQEMKKKEIERKRQAEENRRQLEAVASIASSSSGTTGVSRPSSEYSPKRVTKRVNDHKIVFKKLKKEMKELLSSGELKAPCLGFTAECKSNHDILQFDCVCECLKQRSFQKLAPPPSYGQTVEAAKEILNYLARLRDVGEKLYTFGLYSLAKQFCDWLLTCAHAWRTTCSASAVVAIVSACVPRSKGGVTVADAVELFLVHKARYCSGDFESESERALDLADAEKIRQDIEKQVTRPLPIFFALNQVEFTPSDFSRLVEVVTASSIHSDFVDLKGSAGRHGAVTLSFMGGGRRLWTWLAGLLKRLKSHPYSATLLMEFLRHCERFMEARFGRIWKALTGKLSSPQALRDLQTSVNNAEVASGSRQIRDLRQALEWIEERKESSEKLAFGIVDDGLVLGEGMSAGAEQGGFEKGEYAPTKVVYRVLSHRKRYEKLLKLVKVSLDNGGVRVPGKHPCLGFTGRCRREHRSLDFACVTKSMKQKCFKHLDPPDLERIVGVAVEILCYLGKLLQAGGDSLYAFGLYSIGNELLEWVLGDNAGSWKKFCCPVAATLSIVARCLPPSSQGITIEDGIELFLVNRESYCSGEFKTTPCRGKTDSEIQADIKRNITKPLPLFFALNQVEFSRSECKIIVGKLRTAGLHPRFKETFEKSLETLRIEEKIRTGVVRLPLMGGGARLWSWVVSLLRQLRPHSQAHHYSALLLREFVKYCDVFLSGKYGHIWKKVVAQLKTQSTRRDLAMSVKTAEDSAKSSGSEIPEIRTALCLREDWANWIKDTARSPECGSLNLEIMRNENEKLRFVVPRR